MTKTHKNVLSPKHKKMFWVLLLISDWQWWHCRLLAHSCTPCTKQQKCINPLPARDCAPLEQFNFSNDLQGRTSKSETFILQTLFHSENSLKVQIYAGHVMSSSQTGKDFAKSMNIICDILMARNGSIKFFFSMHSTRQSVLQTWPISMQNFNAAVKNNDVCVWGWGWVLNIHG